MRFFCINDRAPKTTIELLARACEARGVAFHEIHAPAFRFDPQAGLQRGDMLYRPAVSGAAARVEQFLWRDGLASFHRDPLGPFFHADAYPLLFQGLGISVPRTLPVVSRDREAMRAAVEALGGLPVVVKLLGFEGGVGVLRVDSLPALFSTLDYLLASGREPLLAAYIEDAVHWRVVVLGGRAIAAYRNVPEADDFRTYASEDPADFVTEPPPELEQLAVAAADALRTDFAGVDLLRHPSGRCYLLEANFPCWFAQSQLVAGVDVAGAMVERLIQVRQSLCECEISD
jgi:hypothetical protein